MAALRKFMISLCILGILMIAGCDINFGDGINHPRGWTDETHGPNADANYDVVFAQDTVKRIDLIITPWNWKIMLDDMTDLAGEFGAREGRQREDGGIPEEMMDACEDLQEGDPCSYTDNGTVVEGACADMPMMEELFCTDIFIACEGLQEGDSCNYMDNGTIVEGLCTDMPMMEQLFCTNMFMACEGLQEGDPCSTVRDGEEMSGTCAKIPMLNQGMICMPDDEEGMPGGSGGLDLLARDPIFRPCNIVFEGKTWWHVGVRFKGNSSVLSAWGSGSYKIPLRLDFDQFEDQYPRIEDQRFFGFKKLTMSSNSYDNSMIREKVVADIFREAGVPSAATAFYRVYVDYGKGPVYFGLYTMVEDPDGPMLVTQFNDGSGNLYKPDGSGATFVEFDEGSFVKKTNPDEADWSDVIAVFDALHADRNDPKAWRAGLEAVFDVNGFLLWLAVNTVVTNWDTYGILPHNYYLYFDPDDGRVHWIPWDNNMAMMTFMPPLSLSLDEVDENWPLIRYLLDDPVYRASYIFFVRETVDGVFNLEKTRVRFQEAHDLIAPYVVGPEGEQEGYTHLLDPDDFYTELENLLDFATQRQEAALQFLADEGFSPSPVVINEIHYNPASSQGEEFEFVELLNTGSEVVDLSDFSFIAGIDFVFPPGTSIAAGEYILVCRSAAAYGDNPCQVFEWPQGKLSNRGETLLLNNPEGLIADYVRYDDQGYWPTEADGGGPALELGSGAEINSLADSWFASQEPGGTPGQPNSSSVKKQTTTN